MMMVAYWRGMIFLDRLREVGYIVFLGLLRLMDDVIAEKAYDAVEGGLMPRRLVTPLRAV